MVDRSARHGGMRDVKPADRFGRSTRIVPVAFGLLGAATLLLGLILAVMPIRVPRVGDSSGFSCFPVTSALADAPLSEDCGPHVQVRLAESAVAAITGGAFEVVALVVALALAREAEPGQRARS